MCTGQSTRCHKPQIRNKPSEIPSKFVLWGWVSLEWHHTNVSLQTRVTSFKHATRGFKKTLCSPSSAHQCRTGLCGPYKLLAEGGLRSRSTTTGHWSHFHVMQNFAKWATWTHNSATRFFQFAWQKEVPQERSSSAQWSRLRHHSWNLRVWQGPSQLSQTNRGIDSGLRSEGSSIFLQKIYKKGTFLPYFCHTLLSSLQCTVEHKVTTKTSQQMQFNSITRWLTSFI